MEQGTGTTRWTTEAVRAVLRKRYPGPEWSLLFEVASGPRYADAVAINLWESRGHAILGFEIKVGRADWLRELKKPGKSEPVQRYCDGWYIVAPRSIVNVDELPPTWGLIELIGTATMRVVRQAPKLPAKDLTRAFFAALVRRSDEDLARQAARMVSAQLVDARQRNEEHIQAEVTRRTRSNGALEAAVERFTAATGLQIDPWHGPEKTTIALAQRLERLSGYDKTKVFERVADLAQQMEHTIKFMRDFMKQPEVEALSTPPAEANL